MALKIEWSDEALKNLDDLILYLENNWDKKVIQRFFRRMETIIETLSLYPSAYRLVVKKKGIRKAIITKQVSMYYQKKNSGIEIITLLDNRMNPKAIRVALKDKK